MGNKLNEYEELFLDYIIGETDLDTFNNYINDNDYEITNNIYNIEIYKTKLYNKIDMIIEKINLISNKINKDTFYINLYSLYLKMTFNYKYYNYNSEFINNKTNEKLYSIISTDAKKELTHIINFIKKKFISNYSILLVNNNKIINKYLEHLYFLNLYDKDLFYSCDGLFFIVCLFAPKHIERIIELDCLDNNILDQKLVYHKFPSVYKCNKTLLHSSCDYSVMLNKNVYGILVICQPKYVKKLENSQVWNDYINYEDEDSTDIFFNINTNI